MKITGKTLDSRPKMEYKVHISKLVSIFLQTVFGYVNFEMQIQQHFSKCESYLRERERERERETLTCGERGSKERDRYASSLL